MAADSFSQHINPDVWKLYKVCTCGGVLKHRYRHATNTMLELHILPTRNQFRILNNGRQTHTGNLQQLQQTLQAL